MATFDPAAYGPVFTPLLDVEHGTGTLEKHFPAMMMQFERFGIDISKDPVLIYPTLHYHNGGVKIDTNSETDIKNLFVAGEASGGLHGRNRLMGNSLLDLMVFGKRSGPPPSQANGAGDRRERLAPVPPEGANARGPSALREAFVEVADDDGAIVPAGQPADERPGHARRRHERRLSARSFKPDHIRACRARASSSAALPAGVIS